jgi:predicted negative regulator of RcsB-dependent stress response
VDDYLSEKEQWEWLKGWVRSNGLWIVAGIAVGAGILFGMRWWEARTDGIALDAGAKYQQILEALDRKDKTRAQTLTTELERDYASSPYVDQSRLLAARVAVEAGELDKAADALKSVMGTTKDKQLALVARLRLARVLLSQGKPDEAIATLDAVDAGAFKPRYQEARGDALFAKGDKAGALQEYQAARAGSLGQSVDSASLDLKIADLLAENVAPAVASAAPGAAAAARPAAAAPKPPEAK